MTDVANQANQAEEIKEVNAFILTGDVKTVEDHSLTMVTKQVSGDQTYEDHHAIKLDDDTAIDKKFNAKTKRCEVFGHMDIIEVDGQRITVLKAKSVAPATAKAGYVNAARLVGEVARPYEFYPSKKGKTAFGNILIKVGDFFGAATAFKYAAQKLRSVTRGSIVRVQGRIDYRERDNALRMIIDPENTKILKMAEADDPFAAHMGDMKPAHDQPF